MSDGFVAAEELVLTVAQSKPANFPSGGGKGGDVRDTYPGKVSMALQQLVCEWKTDPELSTAYESAAEEIVPVPRGYFFKTGCSCINGHLLMHRQMMTGM